MGRLAHSPPGSQQDGGIHVAVLALNAGDRAQADPVHIGQVGYLSGTVMLMFTDVELARHTRHERAVRMAK